MTALGEDPFDMGAALEYNPRDYIKDLLTPLYTDTGALERAGLLDARAYGGCSDSSSKGYRFSNESNSEVFWYNRASSAHWLSCPGAGMYRKS
jgi:hypothetical protein